MTYNKEFEKFSEDEQKEIREAIFRLGDAALIALVGLNEQPEKRGVAWQAAFFDETFTFKIERAVKGAENG